MDIGSRGRKAAILAVGALLTIGGFEMAASPPGMEAASSADPGIVMSGSYTCNYARYTVGADSEPVTFAETSDSLVFNATGGIVPVGAAGNPPGRGVGPGGPGLIQLAPLSGFGTSHSFNDGSIEDCLRFAQTVSSAARGMGCTTSDVRHREPLPTFFPSTATASFSFVCEGPHASLVHNMGELSRLVLGLRLQPAP